jgi:Na+/melibiose symporter-like transporter
LKYVAEWNGVEEVEGRPYADFRFYSEYKKFGELEEGAKLLETPSDDSSKSKKSEIEGKQEEDDKKFSEENYVGNLVKYCVMWTAASFSLYVLKYYTKYLAGSIFVNYYLDGAAGFTGYLLSVPIYSRCRTKLSYIIGYIVTLIGAILVLISSFDVLPTEKELVMPWFAFIAKVGVHIIFGINYFAGYSNQLTFPLLKRNTALGIC